MKPKVSNLHRWFNSCCFTVAFSFFGNIGIVYAQSESNAVLNLDTAIAEANANDLWIQSNKQSQSAVDALAVSSGTLPDPKVTLAFANLPVDSFEFNQEPMTQFKVEVAQMFPRGDTRQLMQQEKQILSQRFPLQRLDRNAKVTRAVSMNWLDGFKAQNTIALIENDRALFEQLVDVAQANYSSTVRRTRQQDIVRAQLELTQLEDRLTKLYMQQDAARQQLGEWLPTNVLQRDFAQELPALSEPANINATNNDLASILLKHPIVRALEKQIDVAANTIELTKQSYKPEWGVMASYGYRDDAPNNIDRSDFLSLGVSFNVPLFTSNRQDKQVSAATLNAESIKTQKLLLIKEMMSQIKTLQTKLQRNNQRLDLYQQQLLPQVHEQAEAALTAYTNDDGDFAEVMRARIAELNTNIEHLNIQVDRQKLLAQLNYFFAGDLLAAANEE